MISMNAHKGAFYFTLHFTTFLFFLQAQTAVFQEKTLETTPKTSAVISSRAFPFIAGILQTAFVDTSERTKVRITKSEISMRTWRSPMSAASQGAFAAIPEISLCNIPI